MNNNLRLWGLSLISVCAFKLAMALLIGVRPDPVNLTITLIALALGVLFVFWSTSDQGEQADVRGRRVGRGALSRSKLQTRK